ncbi:MAG TPA: S4 domain-containing protein, partial [Candidatus Parcubacteria bacterium]|nr:S4 domain-containing protein [Candidatus Parcubacteria bacterium]
MHGYCSRREADRLVELGKVFINEKAATLGSKVGSDDDVRVEGRDRKKPPKKIYILVNKPSGVIVTSDRSRPDNIIDLIDYE